MSYQVLARKWRPANFSEVAGQSHVLKSLINALDNGRLHHAYLFTGTRGVGKTTLARILARCLNCDKGVSSRPCGQCTACLEINEGRFIDLIEVDAASRTKVEDTRELLENVQYSPGHGRFKVYLIDEVHMLSNHSFNALLKTLEEPPPHVKFLFATTDPQKLPITILSRCLQFNLKNLAPSLIVEYLQKVLDQEAIVYDEDSLWQIAASAAGSMRDALTLTDQAISYCQGKVAKNGVVEMLGVPEQALVFSLLSSMAAADVSAVLKLVNELSDRSPDYLYTLDSLLSCLHRLAIAQLAPKSLDNSFGDQQQLQALASLFSAEDLQLFYQIGVQGRSDLRASTDPRSAFEMLLIRMMLFSPTLVNDDLKPQLPAAPASPSDKEPVGKEPAQKESAEKKEPAAAADHSAPGPATAADSGSVAAADPDGSEPEREPQPESELAVDESQSASDQTATDESAPADESAAAGESGSGSEPTLTGETRSVSDRAPIEDSESPPVPDEPVTAPAPGEDHNGQLQGSKPPGDLAALDHQRWLTLYPDLKLTGVAANVLANAQLQRVEDNSLYFCLDPDQSAMFSDGLLPRLEAALSRHFPNPVRVHMTVDKPSAETPAQQMKRLQQTRQLDLVQRFEQDDNVQQLKKRFSATVAAESITPVGEQGEPNGRSE